MEKIVLQGRGVIPGVVEGKALVCERSITGWGGIDPETGVIKEHGHVHQGECIKDTILIMPGSKGSNGWSCYFGAARVAKTAPKGWVLSRIDSSAGVASAVMRIPTVVDFDRDKDPCQIVRTGDTVRIDGTKGTLEILSR